MSDRDPLERWNAFSDAVRARLEAGRATYGDKSFVRPPHELVGEIRQELLDVCGWSFVLWTRLDDLEKSVAQQLQAQHADADGKDR